MDTVTVRYKYPRIACLFGALLCIVSASIPAEAAGVIAAYYDGSVPVATIPADRLDYVIYAFVEPDDEDLCAAPTAAQLEIFTGLRKLRAQHPGLHLLLSIGGWGAAPQYSDLALTADSRAAFAHSCIQQYVVQQGFEGIDLDWEFPVHGGLNKSRPQDRDDATALAQELRRQLDTQGQQDHRHYYLTAATPAGTWQQGGAYSVSDSYDLAALAASVDWLNVMTYDMNNVFSPVTGFNTPLHADPRDPTPNPQRKFDNLEGAIQYFESHSVAADKIMLGVAFYGRGFTGVSPAGAGLYSAYKGGYDETAWKDICAKFLTDRDWEQHRSDTAGAPWLYNSKKQVFFSYDDPESMALKADFARQQHLRGVMIWVLGEDDPQDSLLHALTSSGKKQ